MALSKQGKSDLKKQLDRRTTDEAIQREWVAIEDRNESSRTLVRLQHQENKEQNAWERGVHENETFRTHMAENEEKRHQEKLRTIECNNTLEEERIDNEMEYDKFLKQQETNNKHEHIKELQGQMINEKLPRCKYEKFLKEKKLIDAVVERIHREDEQALQEKWLRKQKTKDEMMAFKEAQEVWKEIQRKQIKEENRKIQEYMFSSHADVEASGHDIGQAHDEMVDSIGKRTEQRQMENIQEELLEQDRIESADLRELIEVEKRFRQRIDIIRDLDSQEKEHEERKEQEAIDEASYRDKMQKNAEEETKLELMSYEKGRIRKIQLRRDLEDLEAERERKHVKNMQLLLALHDQELKQLAERKRKIEEERVRSLKEHAEHLIGYMPRGILREEDIPLLGDAVYHKYKH